jgi:hypothetical protein
LQRFIFQRTELLVRQTTVAKLRDEKEKFEVIDIAKFSEFVKATSPVHDQEFQVCTLDRIHSKFQLTIESIKLKVQDLMESSQGHVSIVFFDFCNESKFKTSKSPFDTDFDDAIALSVVCISS